MSIIYTSIFDVSSIKQNKVVPESKNTIQYVKNQAIKLHIQLSNPFLNMVKYDFLQIYIENMSLKEVQILSKVLFRYFYFKKINISLVNTQSSKFSNNIYQKSKPLVIRQVNLKTEEDKKEVDKLKEKNKDFITKINVLINAICIQLVKSNELTHLTINGLSFAFKHSKDLKNSLSKNKTLVHFILNNCNFFESTSQFFINEDKIESLDNKECNQDQVDLILESFLSHDKIEQIEVMGNNLNDKISKTISRILVRQTQLRDQKLWLNGLRNDSLSNYFLSGLIVIDLSNNKITSEACESISYALISDNYLKKICLKDNHISEIGCRHLSKMLNFNNSLLNVDLRNNPGFDDHYKMKFKYKLSKNIKDFIQKNGLKDNVSFLNNIVCLELFDCKSFKEPNQVYKSLISNILKRRKTNENNEVKVDEKNNILLLNNCSVDNNNINTNKDNNNTFNEPNLNDQKNVKILDKNNDEYDILKKIAIDDNKFQVEERDFLINEEVFSSYSNDDDNYYEKENENENFGNNSFQNLNQLDEIIDEVQNLNYSYSKEANFNSLEENQIRYNHNPIVKTLNNYIDKLSKKNTSLFLENINLTKKYQSLISHNNTKYSESNKTDKTGLNQNSYLGISNNNISTNNPFKKALIYGVDENVKKLFNSTNNNFYNDINLSQNIIDKRGDKTNSDNAEINERIEKFYSEFKDLVNCYNHYCQK